MGRPKGSTNKVKKALLKDTGEDLLVKTVRLKGDALEAYEKPHQCFACGKRYAGTKGNFSFSHSPLFDGLKRLPWCKTCVDKLYEHYMRELGSDDEALIRMAMKLDLFVDDITLKSCKNISADRNKIQNLIRLNNLAQNNDKSFDDYLREIRGEIEVTSENIDDIKGESGSNITKTMIDRWGSQNEETLLALEEHYRLLKKQNPNADSNAEIFIKDLCYTKVLQQKAFKENNSGDFEKYSKLYRDTFKAAGLQTVAETDMSAEETFGVTLATISQYTPEQYYKDKHLYDDFSGIGDYIKRFLLRPLKNLMLGGNEADPEFDIGGGDDET